VSTGKISTNKGGLAAVDIYIGATVLPEDDPMNRIFPSSQ